MPSSLRGARSFVRVKEVYSLLLFSSLLFTMLNREKEQQRIGLINFNKAPFCIENVDDVHREHVQCNCDSDDSNGCGTPVLFRRESRLTNT